MGLFSRREHINLVTRFRAEGKVLGTDDPATAVAYLRDFVSMIRPEDGMRAEATERMQQAIRMLHEDPSVAANLRYAISLHVRNADLVPMFTESGMANSRSAGKEFWARLKHKVLPPLRDDRDFLRLLNTIFYRKDDYRWVDQVPVQDWSALVDILGFSLTDPGTAFRAQVMHAIRKLCTAVAQLGWEKEVDDYLPPGLRKEQSPYYRLLIVAMDMEQEMAGTDLQALQVQAAFLKQSAETCLAGISHIRQNTVERGASLSQSFLVFQLEQKLHRIMLLLDFVDADDQVDTRRMIQYFREVVRYENRRNSMREFFRQTTNYLAYQIAEQKGKKGNKYITSTPAEYRAMLISAMKGGVIICFVAIIKNLLGFLRLAPFWQGFAYSVNYSAGFVIIEQTHSTLATKQPAFTANAVAASLDDKQGGGQPRLYNLAVTIAKVSRSQFASFVGNLIVVFPGTYVLAWLYDLVFGAPIVSGPDAEALLRAQHPWQSLSLLYACNTGFFLFLSGLIAGYVQNKMQYGRIAERLVRHPILGATARPGRMERIARYWNQHAGTIAGSVALGFFLGMAGLVGKIFGIPFDIRHITIAAGNASIGLYGMAWTDPDWWFLSITFLGILGIGFLNFLVSFALSFFVALRSRGLDLRDFPAFLGILSRYFRNYPLDFIRPRRRISE